MGRRFLSLLIVAAATLASSDARAGTVQTATARLEGKVVIVKDHVLVDGKKVAWADVLVLIPDGQQKTPPPQRIGFKNGEVWAVELLGLAEKKLEVRSDLFGKHRIDLEPVAVLEFTPRPARLADLKPQTLYREKGEPVPGKLLTIDRDKLGLDSLLGALSLPRAGLTRYVLENHVNPVPMNQELDEVTLSEGSILRGRLRPGADALELEHALLGRVSLPTTAVRSLVRYRPTVVHLTELFPQSVATAPLLGAGGTARMQTVRPEKPQGYVRGLHVEPKTTVRYALPPHTGPRQLRAILVAVEEAKGDARVRIRAGAKVVFDGECKASAAPRELALDLPEGDELTIEVDFGERLRFPCGVVLGDPCVIVTKQ